MDAREDIPLPLQYPLPPVQYSPNVGISIRTYKISLKFLQKLITGIKGR
jgi:hypothetical protein